MYGTAFCYTQYYLLIFICKSLFNAPFSPDAEVMACPHWKPTTTVPRRLELVVRHLYVVLCTGVSELHGGSGIQTQGYLFLHHIFIRTTHFL